MQQITDSDGHIWELPCMHDPNLNMGIDITDPKYTTINRNFFSEVKHINEPVFSEEWSKLTPTKDELNSLWFNKIWNVINTWDVNVEGAYAGYCSANGNHVCAILRALVEDKECTTQE